MVDVLRQREDLKGDEDLLGEEDLPGEDLPGEEELPGEDLPVEQDLPGKDLRRQSSEGPDRSVASTLSDSARQSQWEVESAQEGWMESATSPVSCRGWEELGSRSASWDEEWEVEAWPEAPN
jgi:hypothetical protein